MLTTIRACFPRNDAVVLVQSTPLLRRATVPRSGPGPRNNRQSILYVNRIVRTLPTTAIPARNPAPHRIADSPPTRGPKEARPLQRPRRDHHRPRRRPQLRHQNLPQRRTHERHRASPHARGRSFQKSIQNRWPSTMPNFRSRPVWFITRS